MRDWLSILCLACALTACAAPISEASDISRAVLTASAINADADYPQSHASTIAETSDGQIVAGWFGGVHERHSEVGIYVAHWEPVLTLERKPLKEGYAYPAIIPASDGKVHVTYTVGRERIKHLVIDPARLSDVAQKKLALVLLNATARHFG